MLLNIWSIFLLVFGFGFVIFFHELGHFLAAKWVGIKVEQFAVGFGQALLAYRKGLGVRIGTTRPEYEKLTDAYLRENEGGLKTTHELANARTEDQRRDAAAHALGMSETEYRLNWIPLGGYVKMLGQDDMKPGQESEDPRAYNRKSVGARMVVVSAGVIMNIILAAIGFMIVFMAGFNAPPAIVGMVVPGSPADRTVRVVGSRQEPAPLEVGDKILYFEDKYQHDFTKISLNVALSEANTPVPLYVERVNGTAEQLYVTPRRRTEDPKEFLMIGVDKAYELRGLAGKEAIGFDKLDTKRVRPDAISIEPGDTIVRIGETEVKDLKQFYLLDQALQAARGKSVPVTVKKANGNFREIKVKPYFQETFSKDPLNFAGMLMRPAINSVMEGSPAMGKILPGDVVVSVIGADKNGDAKTAPTTEEFRDFVNKAGANDAAIKVVVLRGDKTIEVDPIVPNMKIESGRYGVGLGLEHDQDHPVVAGTVAGSPAGRAGIPQGALLTKINDKPVKSWFDVNNVLVEVEPDMPIHVDAIDRDGKARSFTIDRLTKEEIAALAENSYRHALFLHPLEMPRKAPNPLIAAAWGVTETRDFVLQFYLTLKRMIQGSISPKNMMGPVGMIHAGTMFAFKGVVWLIWFLSMISANLAVVNFLPIPIVDGGLFTFLIIEKLQGRPISARTQQVAQVVGLALILGIFLIVTYQDVMRLPIFN